MIQKVAIVDIDIHHGNGTEEIVRNLWPRKKTLPLPPSHAPISYETYKPWLDETDKDNVFLASLHLYDDGEGQFYPGGGGAEDSTILPSGKRCRPWTHRAGPLDESGSTGIDSSV